LSLQFDYAVDVYTKPYGTLAAVPGATAIPNTPAGIGYAVALPGAPSTFDAARPNVLLYAGTSADSRLAGVAWRISGPEPAGFPGARDGWTEVTSGEWWLTAWIVRGYENHPNVFATAHPCLATGVTLSSTTDACFVASHTEPFEVLVTNDDGYSAAGIDAVVQGLWALPNSVIHVVAPLANQSGGGGNITNPPYVISGSAVTTLSGRPATAVSSNDPAKLPSGSAWPADAVLFALRKSDLSLSPELVVSGINEGQNMGSFTPLSGTVGAARRARSNGVPAIASSQGAFGPPPDYATGTAATLALVEEWRLGRTVNTTSSVLNINIPTCAVGFSVRGTVQTVVATNATDYTLQDCSSTATANSVISDIDAFNKGFIGIADVGVSKPPNWP
jgi:5'-nucleotidase